MIITSIVVAATAAAVSERFDSFSTVGGIIGTSVSAAFLILLGLMNAYILYKLVKQMEKVFNLPEGHEDAENFLPQQLEEGQLFDLVICDGPVLRQHSSAPYGESQGARRVAITQLALGLQHLRPGGTMIVLLHRLETWNTVNLIWEFHKISSVRLFKPKSCYTKRSTFYMVATNVESQRPEAIEAVKLWKRIWWMATFGSDEEYGKVLLDEESSVETLLEGFGPELVNLGKAIWKTEADSLANVPSVKKPE